MSKQLGLWKQICKFLGFKSVSDGSTRKRKDVGNSPKGLATTIEKKVTYDENGNRWVQCIGPKLTKEQILKISEIYLSRKNSV